MIFNSIKPVSRYSSIANMLPSGGPILTRWVLNTICVLNFNKFSIIEPIFDLMVSLDKAYEDIKLYFLELLSSRTLEPILD